MTTSDEASSELTSSAPASVEASTSPPQLKLGGTWDAPTIEGTAAAVRQTFGTEDLGEANAMLRQLIAAVGRNDA